MNNNLYFQDKRQEKLFFDSFPSGKYDVFTEEGYMRLLDLFKKELTPVDNLKILDLGCGSGAFTKYLLKFKSQVFGLDISYHLLNKADKKDMIHFVLGDIENLPFNDNSFDIVIFSAVLHHFLCLDKPIKEAHRILKKNGKCFAFDPNGRNPIMWVFRSKKSPFFYSRGITLNERLLESKEIENMFRANGFKVKTFTVSGVPFKYVYSKIIRIFLPIYNLLDNLFAKISLSSRYGSFILTFAEKY